VKENYEAWDPLWKEIGPALTRWIEKDNYLRIFDESRRNVRACEREHRGERPQCRNTPVASGILQLLFFALGFE
jgi:hypothetical protein